MTDISVHLRHSDTLDLRVVVRGSAVRFFEGWRDPGVPEGAAPAVLARVDPDEVVPDPLAFIVECTDMGFFAGSDRPGGEPALVIRSTSRDAERHEVTWALRLEWLDIRIAKVMGNVLLARGLDTIQFEGTAPGNPEAPSLLELPSGYPPAPATTMFSIDYEPPARRLRDRLVRIELAHPPSDTVLDSLYYRLDLWLKLMLLGAFPLPRQSPRNSGVVPEMPALVEPNVIEQTFTEAFYCDESAFKVLLCSLDRWSRTVAPIRHIQIR